MRSVSAATELLWKTVERVLLTHHYRPDTQAARALYSAIAAHRLPGPPVWPIIVAPPGSLKTELLEPLDGLAGVLLVDQITPKTFLSGQIEDPKQSKNTSPSLLIRIGGNGILVYPDFSTVLSMNRDNRGSVLADMRRIYDGHLRKEFGTADRLGDREWRGRITFAVAATPDVDRRPPIRMGIEFRMFPPNRHDVLTVFGTPDGIASACQIGQLCLRMHYLELSRQRSSLPDFADVEFSCFSQNGEDGIALVGAPTRRAVEIGAGTVSSAIQRT
jgi:hypothetical protein